MKIDIEFAFSLKVIFYYKLNLKSASFSQEIWIML